MTNEEVDLADAQEAMKEVGEGKSLENLDGFEV